MKVKITSTVPQDRVRDLRSVNVVIKEYSPESKHGFYEVFWPREDLPATSIAASVNHSYMGMYQTEERAVANAEARALTRLLLWQYRDVDQVNLFIQRNVHIGQSAVRFHQMELVKTLTREDATSRWCEQMGRMPIRPRLPKGE
jgi:hypothetical protein